MLCIFPIIIKDIRCALIYIVALKDTIEECNIILCYTKSPQVNKKIINLSMYLWCMCMYFLHIF